MTRSRRQNRTDTRGFTLMETLIGAGLISTAVLGIASLSGNLSKSMSNLDQASRASRLIASVQDDILSEERFYPAAPPGSLPAEPFDPVQNPRYLEQRCYANDGGIVADSNSGACAIRVSFYKEQLADRSLPAGSVLAPLPMYRMVFRVQYEVDKQAKEMVFSRLITQVLPQ